MKLNLMIVMFVMVFSLGGSFNLIKKATALLETLAEEECTQAMPRSIQTSLQAVREAVGNLGNGIPPKIMPEENGKGFWHQILDGMQYFYV